MLWKEHSPENLDTGTRLFPVCNSESLGSGASLPTCLVLKFSIGIKKKKNGLCHLSKAFSLQNPVFCQRSLDEDSCFNGLAPLTQHKRISVSAPERYWF